MSKYIYFTFEEKILAWRINFENFELWLYIWRCNDTRMSMSYRDHKFPSIKVSHQNMHTRDSRTCCFSQSIFHTDSKKKKIHTYHYMDYVRIDATFSLIVHINMSWSIFVEWIQSTHNKVLYGYVILLSSQVTQHSWSFRSFWIIPLYRDFRILFI